MSAKTLTEKASLALTPAQIVAELDRYIVGQESAKRAVAVALRNRWRWQQLPDEIRRDIFPKNILMIGPTGVGKTEIARRVAKLVDAPFIKVEATKFTEVGYVGRDVESIVRELVEASISMLHGERLEAVRDEAARAALQRLVDLLVEQRMRRRGARSSKDEGEEGEHAEENETPEERRKREAAQRRRLNRQRRRLLELLSHDGLEDETIELDIDTDFDVFIEGNGDFAAEELQEAFGEFLESFPRRRTRRVSIREARRILTQQEAQRLIDFDTVIEAAIKRAEESGIIFIDEIDKLITRGSGEYGPDVSGEGVQRDLLPIVEGSVVMTRYGPVRTDHMLFIAAGAFHGVSPSDLIPELQGRFPIRVELQRLSGGDLYKILTVPENALTRQYAEMLRVEGVTLTFTEDGLREIARYAAEVNERTEDIGARRLATIMERVLEDISFHAPDYAGQTVTIDAAYVRSRVDDVAADDDLSKFIL